MNESEPSCSLSQVKTEFESPGNSHNSESPPQFSGANEEMDSIWSFLIAELHRQPEPLKRGRFSENIWQEYRESTGSTTEVEDLQALFSKNSHTLSGIGTDISIETIVKMHFVYQIPVERMLLESLKMNAEVVVGETNCLVAYLEHSPDGLKIFDQVPMEVPEEASQEPPETSEQDPEAEEAQEAPEVPENEEYEELETPRGSQEHGAPQPEEPEEPQASQSSQEPQESTEKDDDMEVDAALGDSDAEDCKPDLSKLRPKRQKFSDEEELQMWKFLLKQVKNTETGLPEKNLISSKGLAIWEEFKKEHKSTRAAQALNGRFRRLMVPNLHKAKLSNEHKLVLYYGLDIPVDAAYLEKLRTAAFVRVNQQGCITMYRKKKNVKNETNGEEQAEEVQKEDEVQEGEKTKKKKEKKKGKKRRREVEEEQEAEGSAKRRSSRLSSVGPSGASKIPPEFHALLEERTKVPVSQLAPLKCVRLSVDMSTQSTSQPTQPTQPTQPVFAEIEDVSPAASDTDTSGQGREASPDKSIQATSTDDCSSKDFLMNMKNLVADLKAPLLEDTLRKLEERIQNTPEDVKLSMDRVKVILQAALAIIPE